MCEEMLCERNTWIGRGRKKYSPRIVGHHVAFSMSDLSMSSMAKVGLPVLFGRCAGADAYDSTSSPPPPPPGEDWQEEWSSLPSLFDSSSVSFGSLCENGAMASCVLCVVLCVVCSKDSKDIYVYMYVCENE